MFELFRSDNFEGIFNEKPVFNVCTKRPLAGKRAENIALFFNDIGLRIFCSTLCAKFEKKTYREQRSCQKDNVWKKNTDGVNAIGSSSKDSRLKIRTERMQ